MTMHSTYRAVSTPRATGPSRFSAARFSATPRYSPQEGRLRAEIVAKDALLRAKDELIEQQNVAQEECDHRLMNSLQMIASLISLQSHAPGTVVGAAQLAVVADRIAAIGRIHRHLHRFDGVQQIAVRPYIEEYCSEFASMLASDDRPGLRLVVDCIDLRLPAAIAIPLGFILNELVTNAAKYGEGPITVRLQRRAEGGYALVVCNDGPGLPESFDPAASKGLGMKILRSFVTKIGGELLIGRNDADRGAQFSVLFS